MPRLSAPRDGLSPHIQAPRARPHHKGGRGVRSSSRGAISACRHMFVFYSNSAPWWLPVVVLGLQLFPVVASAALSLLIPLAGLASAGALAWWAWGKLGRGGGAQAAGCVDGRRAGSRFLARAPLAPLSLARAPPRPLWEPTPRGVHSSPLTRVTPRNRTAHLARRGPRRAKAPRGASFLRRASAFPNPGKAPRARSFGRAPPRCGPASVCVWGVPPCVERVRRPCVASSGCVSLLDFASRPGFPVPAPLPSDGWRDTRWTASLSLRVERMAEAGAALSPRSPTGRCCAAGRRISGRGLESSVGRSPAGSLARAAAGGRAAQAVAEEVAGGCGIPTRSA